MAKKPKEIGKVVPRSPREVAEHALFLAKLDIDYFLATLYDARQKNDQLEIARAHIHLEALHEEVYGAV